MADSGLNAPARAGSLFMSRMGHYQYMYAWSAVATGIGFAAMLAVYRGRQRHGGVKNFVPPAALPKPA